MACEHDLAEMDTAAHWDGLCPICLQAEVYRLRALAESDHQIIWELVVALQNLHDWNVEYAKINNLFNADGSPATFHQLLEARRLLMGN